jgi:rubrerythrin
MITSPTAIENETTIRNLLSAFEGESNAHAKYTSFAVRADGEGLHGAASLFRAVARAEQIHADNHARVIRQLGGEPAVSFHSVEIRSTLENLNEARAGERYEIESMYPEFLREARRRNNTAAIRTFEWALEAERTHARLFSEAIAVLESGWLIAARNFYVCTVCGHTSEAAEGECCPACNLHWDKFEIVQ